MQEEAAILGVSLVLVITALHLPIGLAGYLFLLSCLVYVPKNVFALWILYSFVFWSSRVAEEDSPLLLALTTVAQVVALIVRFLYRRYEHHLYYPLMALLMLPNQCNNLYYFPLLSLFRIAVFLGLMQVERQNDGWLVHQVALFSKKEALVVVLSVYVFWKLKVEQPPPAVPVLPLAERPHSPTPRDSFLDKADAFLKNLKNSPPD